MKTGTSTHFSNFQNLQNLIKSANNKIPEYASDFKREYQFIRLINREFKYFLNKLDDLNRGLFESNISNRIKYFMTRFLKAQEKGKLKDISNLIFPSYDIDNIRNLLLINENFKMYKLRYDAFCDEDDDNDYYIDDEDDDDGNGEYLVDGKPYPGFIELYNIFKIFFNQIKYKGYDSDSESESDSEDYDIVIQFSDSEDDCDSDSDSDDF